MEKTKKRKISRTAMNLLIFAAGLVIFVYPIVSRYLYEKKADSVIQNFEDGKDEIDDGEISDRLKQAYAFNAALAMQANAAAFTDPFTREELEVGVESFARMLEVNEQIGYISIPVLDVHAPIYTGTMENVLQKGIGLLEGSSLPVGGENSHSVLVGHRGLPSAKFFTELDKMKEGDLFYLSNIGGTLAYEVDQIRIVKPTDFDEVMIAAGEDYCTLLTCTPYMINTDRLLVRGHRVPVPEEEAEEEIIPLRPDDPDYRILLVGGSFFLAALLYLLFKIISKRRKNSSG